MANYSAFHWSEKARKYAEEAQKRGKALVFRGSVQTFEDLPTTADIGDMYDVLENGANYAWTGEKWDNLGGIFDTLPNQLGQEGKYLKTNGNNAYWDEALEKDDKTINLNADNKAQAIGVIEKNNGNVKYDWIGTLAEYKEQNIETLHKDWVCLVTDDVQQNPEDITKDIKINNPFSLLDYKWSEYAINNSSWLISNSSFHSGTAYTAVYSLLLKIHNGTETKDGVSVKLSTEEYTDTDFVLDTANTTFRLPVKVLLASGNRVAGTGKTLGMTNGTIDAGLLYTTGNGYVSSIGALNKDIGTSGYTANSMGDGVAVGVTTDPSKSGIETSSQDLYLYFYVGETVQDANVIVASQVLTEIANLKGYDYVVESYGPDEDGDWYRIYKSGWIEQGGNLRDSSGVASTVNLLKEMSSNIYTLFLQQYGSGNIALIVKNVTTTSFDYSGNIGKDSWLVMGKMA